MPSDNFLTRVTRGVRYIITGAASGFFVPNQPIQPVAQDTAQGRQFDYPTSFNLLMKPRSHEAVTFEQLRALADNCDLARLAIETRKDQLKALSWNVKPRDEKKNPPRLCKDIEKFFAYPDKEHDWRTWLGMVLEDMFVIDAPTLYVRNTIGNDLYSFDPVDGATIKRLINPQGRTPMPPDPAFQQYIKGMPSVNYSADELIYRPRNVRTHKIYGYSPIEQIITVVNIAIRRSASQLSYYTKGSIPDGYFEMPEGWTQEQINQFEGYWNAMLAGDDAARRQVKAVGHGAVFHDIKPNLIKDEFDEWLARVICFAFSLPPNAFVKMMNRATAEVAQEASLDEGLEPSKLWVKALMDFIITKYFNAPDLAFFWEEKKMQAPLEASQVHATYLDRGVLEVNEVRDELGLDPLEEDEADIEMKDKGAFGDKTDVNAEAEDAADSEKPDEEKDKGEPVKKSLGALFKAQKKNQACCPQHSGAGEGAKETKGRPY